jgi:tetratricopeptide (TPR) repeat protein
LLRGKEFNGAAEQFQLIVKKNPANAEALFLLGNALAAGGKLDSAIEKFREVIRLKPDFDDAYVGLARALATSGRTEEAMQVYQKALTILKSKKQADKNAAAKAPGRDTR